MAPRTAPFRVGPDFQYPSRIELPNQTDPTGPQMVLTLCAPSELSTYHLDTLLEYGETGIRNEQHKYRYPTRKIVRPKNRKATKKLPQFLKLPVELQSLILKLAFLQQHRRVLLTLFGAEVHREGTKEILTPLLVSHRIKEAFELNYHRLFTLGPLLINSDKDMLVFDDSSTCSLDDFRPCADMIKAVAVSIQRPDFPSFVNELRNYPNLEVVFIILPFNLHERDERENIVRAWGDADEHRLSHKKEVMFERIHPNNPYIAGVEIRSNLIAGEIKPTGDVRDIRTLYFLHLQMARVVGESRITPHIRYVRLIPEGRLEREEVNDAEDEWDSGEDRPARRIIRRSRHGYGNRRVLRL
jgi:hypothetical protein